MIIMVDLLVLGLRIHLHVIIKLKYLLGAIVRHFILGALGGKDWDGLGMGNGGFWGEIGVWGTGGVWRFDFLGFF